MTIIELMMLVALGWFVALPLLMLALYTLFIQHNRGGIFKVCMLVALIAWPLDVVMARIWFPLYLDHPGKGEWTVSQQIDRIVRYAQPNWLGYATKRAFRLGRLLNRIDPLHNHIKSLAEEDRLLSQINDESAA